MKRRTTKVNLYNNIIKLTKRHKNDLQNNILPIDFKNELKDILFHKVKFVWLKSLPELIDLFKLLQTNEYIDNILETDKNSESYIANFIDNKGNLFTKVEPIEIEWKKGINELIMILGGLIENKYLSKRKVWKVTSIVFYRIQKNPYKNYGEKIRLKAKTYGMYYYRDSLSCGSGYHSLIYVLKKHFNQP